MIPFIVAPNDGRRWVYLDIGRYGGLAETENEYIRYRLRTSRDGDPAAEAVLAGPTCDGDGKPPTPFSRML